MGIEKAIKWAFFLYPFYQKSEVKTMWIEELSNGKYKYFERYKDPYTEKWRKVSVTLESGSNRAKKEAQKLLNEKIDSKLEKLKTTDALFITVFEEDRKSVV